MLRSICEALSHKPDALFISRWHSSGTEDARRLGKKCEDAFLRAVYHIKLHDIPASLVINADQTGVSLLPMGSKTYAPRGSKQVAMLGKEEKRQFTAMVATSASGNMLPMQCIWSGKTHLSLPWSNFRSDSESRGNRWVPGGDSHWSSLETMKKVRKIVHGSARRAYPHLSL